jgi:hypothetical protein
LEARAIGCAARLILEVRHDLLRLPATAAMLEGLVHAD